jgi:hypothetical protein
MFAIKKNLRFKYDAKMQTVFCLTTPNSLPFNVKNLRNNYMTTLYDLDPDYKRCVLGFKDIDVCANFARRCEDAVITTIDVEELKNVGSMMKMPVLILLDIDKDDNIDAMFIRNDDYDLERKKSF